MSLPSATADRSLSPRRGRHRAPSKAPARRLGLLGATAALAAGTGALTQVSAGRGDGTAVAAARPEAASSPAARMALRADRSARPARVARPAARVARLAPKVAAASTAVPASLAARPLPTAKTTAAKPRLAMTAWVKPVNSYRLTSKFGPRWGRFHHGLDFACPVGTPLMSISGGTVSDVVSGHRVYGNYVDVKHADGTLARYGHLSKVNVARGAQVSPGQVIALTGNSGMSTGPHLHLEIHAKGDPNLRDAVDPLIELAKRGIRA